VGVGGVWCRLLNRHLLMFYVVLILYVSGLRPLINLVWLSLDYVPHRPSRPKIKVLVWNIHHETTVMRLCQFEWRILD
jgi:hypothetical protein